jgi:predicted nucleic acid-binding protein
MAGTKRRVYFDACLFISWLTGEYEEPEDAAGVNYYVAEAEAGRILILTSVITRIEVLESKLGKEVAERFRLYLKTLGKVPAEVTGKIADCAHAIREYYREKTDGFENVSIPDAIHLATAAFHECDTFLTFDGRDQVQRPNRGRPLLTLKSPIAGRYHVAVALPVAPTAARSQVDLFSKS